ncbi:MAG: transglutaminaseTgpA domain-containing protein, partial [Desulfosudaceae bacterium]
MNRSRRYLSPILGALVVAILPHLGRLPVWIIAWCGIMWGYQLLSLRYRLPLPGKWGRRLLTLGGLAGLTLTYGQGFGPAAYLGLLAVMAAIKPLEMGSHRDRVVVVFLAYFIVITGLFQSESLLMTLYMILSVGVTTAALVRINDPDGAYTDHLKLAGRLLVQALPLMAVLFLLFPRISGSFFGLSRLHTATTGFSETLAPGSVTRLAENDAVAFRVAFAEDKIPDRPLYWRGVVFQHFDGRQWRISRQVPNMESWTGGEAAVTYSVRLEPHNRHWLFALELPAEAPRWTRLRADFTLRTIRSVRRKYSYEMTSHRRYQTGDPRELAAACRQLPETGNPAARELARELAGEADTVEDKVQRVLAYFRGRDFVYTLRPPSLGNNPVDAFLTQNRRGYCEHYASAFAFLMRAMDVPARVVGGYLGGETNPYGDYLLVRQNHAHVWVGVWQADRGWVRVDPTAAVAPERISGDEEDGAAAGSGEFSFGAMARQLQLRWDALSTAWEEWFTGYSHLEQRELLERLG